MIFSSVNDIVIPEGNVIKIHETNSGRILWQKKKSLNPVWSSISAVSIAGNVDNASILCSGNMTDYYNSGLNMRTFITSNVGSVSQGKRTMSPYISKRENNFFISGAYGSYAKTPAQVSYNQNLTYSLSDDGRVMFGHNGSNYYLYSMHGSDNTGNELKTKSPTSETSVYISHSPERNEYLVSGINGGTFTVPDNFSAAYSISQSSKSVSKSVWVAPLNLYFAFSGNNRYVLSSPDGYSWNQIQVFSQGNVADISYMTAKGRLCALNASNNKIATSADGLSWTELDVPFSNPIACSYSPEPDLFCVLNTQAAYLSYDLTNWVNVPLPNNKFVSFREIFHIRNGIFGAYAYKAKELYILSALEKVVIDE